MIADDVTSNDAGSVDAPDSDDFDTDHSLLLMIMLMLLMMVLLRLCSIYDTFICRIQEYLSEEGGKGNMSGQIKENLVLNIIIIKNHHHWKLLVNHHSFSFNN